MLGIINFFKSSYNEFVNFVETPKFTELIDDAKTILTYTVFLILFLYAVDIMFSLSLENFYTLLKS
jgi:preprotein translocase SecE subunit